MGSSRPWLDHQCRLRRRALWTPGTGGYGATKWAVRGLTKVARANGGRLGVRCNGIFPAGWITPMAAPASTTFSCGRNQLMRSSVAGRSAGWLDRPRSHRWPCTSARTSRRIARAPSSSSMAEPRPGPATWTGRQSDVRRREAMAKRIVVVGAGSAGCVVAARSARMSTTSSCCWRPGPIIPTCTWRRTISARFRDGRQGTRLGLLVGANRRAAAVNPGATAGHPNAQGQGRRRVVFCQRRGHQATASERFRRVDCGGKSSLELGASPTRAPRVGGRSRGRRVPRLRRPLHIHRLRATMASGASAVLGRMPGHDFPLVADTTLPIRSAPGPSP